MVEGAGSRSEVDGQAGEYTVAEVSLESGVAQIQRSKVFHVVFV